MQFRAELRAVPSGRTRYSAGIRNLDIYQDKDILLNIIREDASKMQLYKRISAIFSNNNTSRIICSTGRYENLVEALCIIKH